MRLLRKAFSRNFCTRMRAPTTSRRFNMRTNKKKAGKRTKEMDAPKTKKALSEHKFPAPLDKSTRATEQCALRGTKKNKQALNFTDVVSFSSLCALLRSLLFSGLVQRYAGDAAGRCQGLLSVLGGSEPRDGHAGHCHHSRRSHRTVRQEAEGKFRFPILRGLGVRVGPGLFMGTLRRRAFAALTLSEDRLLGSGLMVAYFYFAPFDRLIGGSAFRFDLAFFRFHLGCCCGFLSLFFTGWM